MALSQAFPPAPPPRRSRFWKWLGIALGLFLGILLLALAAVWWALHASLAQLDGDRRVRGLAAPVRIERDAFGVPTIHAGSRLDATRALGFLHAQDRFFQMDLSRRSGGGELSELFGAIALERDRRQRIHRPRGRARAALEHASPAEAALLRAYTEGVNAGLAALTVRPPEYLALRIGPAPWREEDTYLVAYAMFGELHDIDGRHDYEQTILKQAFSPAVLAFLDGPDVGWAAALDDSRLNPPSVPGPEEFSVERGPHQAAASPAKWAKPGAGVANGDESDREAAEPGTVGSNNWAVDGRRSGTGAAIVANDMHLGLSVPNTWYRVRLIYQDPDLGTQDVAGVSLPGAPVVVSGSNGYVAWGNTFSCLDITDLVKLEFAPADPHRYRTPAGWRQLEDFTEVIHVRHETNVTRAVEETIWGPVVTQGKTKYALACTMHDPEGVNLGLIEIERARDMKTALSLANRSGTPVNNFVVGDRMGQIGYSLLGRLPNRQGFDGIAPCSWADGTRGWRGWLPAEEYPRVLNPTNGILWTANNRTLGSPEYTRLHVSAPDNGARARQIRDDLLSLERVSEQTLWGIYRDDRALFLTPWQHLLEAVLANRSATNSTWKVAQDYVRSWGARAAVDSQGYRLVRRFRTRVLDLLFEPFNQELARFDPEVKVFPEDAAWLLLRQRPVHLLNAKFATYDQLLAQAAEQLLAEFGNSSADLAQATWGNHNRLRIRHPLSRAVPKLARWLDMPDAAVSGDSHMPKVHNPGHGVSERMIVSPGHEASGLYNMPGGQSGHFLSPFYRSEMESWLRTEPEPFLPGPPEHRLELVPVRGGPTG